MMYVLTGYSVLVHRRFVSGFIYTDKFSFMEVIDCRYNRHKIHIRNFLSLYPSHHCTSFKVMSIVKYNAGGYIYMYAKLYRFSCVFGNACFEYVFIYIFLENIQVIFLVCFSNLTILQEILLVIKFFTLFRNLYIFPLFQLEEFYEHATKSHFNHFS